MEEDAEIAAAEGLYIVPYDRAFCFGPVYVAGACEFGKEQV